jgi:hypothetical protein
VLQPGDRIPNALVWSAPREDATSLVDAIAGDGLVLLCFYFFDWSTG